MDPADAQKSRNYFLCNPGDTVTLRKGELLKVTVSSNSQCHVTHRGLSYEIREGQLRETAYYANGIQNRTLTRDSKFNHPSQPSLLEWRAETDLVKIVTIPTVQAPPPSRPQQPQTAAEGSNTGTKILLLLLAGGAIAIVFKIYSKVSEKKRAEARRTVANLQKDIETARRELSNIAKKYSPDGLSPKLAAALGAAGALVSAQGNTRRSYLGENPEHDQSQQIRDLKLDKAELYRARESLSEALDGLESSSLLSFEDWAKRFETELNKNLPLEALSADRYVIGTSLPDSPFRQAKAQALTLDEKFLHTYIIGKTGSGKTTLLSTLR